MNNIKDHENLNDKKILLRLDLNVPLKNGVITDYTRIDKILPIIDFLLNKNSKIIVISHVGRPKGKVNKDLSLKLQREIFINLSFGSSNMRNDYYFRVLI